MSLRVGVNIGQRSMPGVLSIAFHIYGGQGLSLNLYQLDILLPLSPTVRVKGAHLYVQLFT